MAKRGDSLTKIEKKVYLRYIMLAYLVGAFLLYFLYKLVVGLIIPVVRTTSAMRRKMEQMQQPQQPNPAQQQPEGPKPSVHKSTASRGDYIDFEEIKDAQ